MTNTQRTESITFPGADGDRLAARLDLPMGAPRAYALFAHCFTCSKDIAAAFRISRRLAEQGIAVLRFDFTGLGRSDGEFANTNFSSNVADLVAAAAWLREHHRAPSLLIGHSLGGTAVLAAAGEISESTAVVSIAAPSDPKHVAHLIRSDLDTIERDGAAEVQLAGRTFTIKKQFLEDVAGQRLADRLHSMKKALLVVHSIFDETVSIDHAAEIFTAAKHPKSFLSLDDADHMLTDPADSQYVADVVASWASRYLPAVAESGPLDDENQEASARPRHRAPQALQNSRQGLRRMRDAEREGGPDRARGADRGG